MFSMLGFDQTFLIPFIFIIITQKILLLALFQCNNCNFTTTTKNYLKEHSQAKHEGGKNLSIRIRCNLYSIHLVVPRINNVVIFIGDWNNCFVCGMKNTPKYYILQIQWNMSCCAFALRHHVMHRALRNTNRAIKRSWKMLNKCYLLKRPKERRWNNHVRCYRWVIQIYWSYLELYIIFALHLVIECLLTLKVKASYERAWKSISWHRSITLLMNLNWN